jgi:hypothetical protein
MFDFPSAAADLMCQDLSVPPSEGVRLCEELGWFFRAVVAEPTAAPLAPSRRVDEAWHVLLRHQDVYQEFCGATCGRLIQHVTDRPSEQKYQVTRDVLRSLRGTVPVMYWPPGDRGDCGGSAEEEEK